MGASASKPTETKVFTPATKIDLGPALVGQLEQSLETDYTRTQYTEKAFEAAVGKKLDQLSKEAADKFDKTLKSSLLTQSTEQDKHLSSKIIDDKLTQLQKSLEARESKFVKVSQEVTDSKKQIVQCLLKNKQQPLSCWDEVQNFEKLVKTLN